MELISIYLILIVLISVIYLLFHVILYKQKAPSTLNLPPGRTGWPVVGETLEFLSTRRKGHPEKFVIDRMIKHSSECFRTSILGQPMAFLCGPSGNKFLFFSHKGRVKPWHPGSIKKIFPYSCGSDARYKEVAAKAKAHFSQFLKAEALQRYVGIMDAMSHKHFTLDWEGKDEILVFPSAKKYVFWLACRLFLSIDDLDHVARLIEPFHELAAGIISIPIDFPGTQFNKAIKAVKFLRKDIAAIIREKKLDLAIKKATPTQDILSHMLSEVDENGEHQLSEFVVAELIVALLLAGFDGVTSAITLIVKYLAEVPHIYDYVYKEQMEIVKSKAPREMLNWRDIQKMKYSWNVACEVMRLAPPSPGVFSEAIEEFTYAGFTIPKGWKLHWSAFSTHLNPQYFPNPEKFDPTRFEGSGPAPYSYVPFGGGPGMCPGKEYARLGILVFMHNLVKRFCWENLVPDEKVVVHLSPTPVKGLPIRLIPHEIRNNNN